MKVSNIYIGGWFQRTMLQLSEIYDFLRGEPNGGGLDLDYKKMLKLRQDLLIEDMGYGVSGEEFIHFSTTTGVNVKIFEDGLIILNYKEVDDKTLFTDIEKVQNYYEQKLSPAFSYLFSLGAPVPKELANIKNVYPYFIVLKMLAKKIWKACSARLTRQSILSSRVTNMTSFVVINIILLTPRLLLPKR